MMPPALRALGPSGAIGFGFVALVVAAGLVGPALLAVDPLTTNPAAALQPPSWQHPFGTDNLGRDLFAGIVWGARTAVMVGFVSVALATFLGVTVGALGGYFGGSVEAVLERLTQLFIVIPRLFLAITLVSLFGTSIWVVIVAIGLVSWPQVARLTRAEFRALHRREFVVAAVALGASSPRIILRHLLPNTLPTLIANGTLLVSAAILLEAGLAFFGLSDPDLVSWGAMLSNAQQFLLVSFWMPLFPGLVLTLTGLALNLLGDGLTRSLNPRLRQSRSRKAS
jgi:peptide/nickel transport system permease protein